MPAAQLPSLPDFVELIYRPEVAVLHMRWLRPVSRAELQQGYEALLAAAHSRQCRFWLLDLGRRGISSEDDTLWLLDTFLPRVAGRLTGRLYLAFVVAPGHLSAAEQEVGAEVVSSDHSHVRLFPSESRATAWLTRRRQLESA